MSEEKYAETEMKEKCEKCGSKNTATHVKRVYEYVDIEDDSFITQTLMPFLKYRQKCNDCGYVFKYLLQ